jgi:hypothetical protein
MLRPLRGEISDANSPTENFSVFCQHFVASHSQFNNLRNGLGELRPLKIQHQIR